MKCFTQDITCLLYTSRKGGLGIHDRDLHAAAELHAQGRDLAVLHVEADRAGLILHVQLLRVRCDGTGGLTRPVGAEGKGCLLYTSRCV